MLTLWFCAPMVVGVSHLAIAIPIFVSPPATQALVATEGVTLASESASFIAPVASPVRVRNSVAWFDIISVLDIGSFAACIIALVYPIDGTYTKL